MRPRITIAETATSTLGRVTRPALTGLIAGIAALLVALAGLSPAQAVVNVVLSGTVVDSTGTPVAGMLVSPSNDYMQVGTDAQGRFSFPVVAGTNMGLKLDLANQSLRWGGARVLYESTHFTPTEDRDFGTLTLPPLAKSTVRIADQYGTAVHAASVSRPSSSSDDWADYDHPIGDGLAVIGIRYGYEGYTPDSGTVEVYYPRFVDNSVPRLTVLKYLPQGGYYSASTDGATGTGTAADPYEARISGYTVQRPTFTAEQVSTDVGDGNVGVSWYPSATANGAELTGYTVTASPGGATKEVNAYTNSVLFFGLTNGTAYTFTVTANSRVGGTTVTTAPVTPRGVPSAPSPITTTMLDATTVKVDWSQPANNGGSPITGYYVDVYPAMSNDFNRTVDPTTTSATFTGLVPGSSYNVSVRAINTIGTGPTAETYLAIDPTPPPPIPTPNPVTTIPPPDAPQTPSPAPAPAVTVQPGKIAKPKAVVKGKTVTVTWKAPALGTATIKNYRVTLHNPGLPKGAKVITAKTLKVIIKNLKPGRYHIDVQAMSTDNRLSPISKPVKFRIE